MVLSGVPRRALTSLLLFIALRVFTCAATDNPSCTPWQCNYTASDLSLDCDHLSCGHFLNFSSWTLPVETLTVRGNNILHVTSLGHVCSLLQYLDLSDNRISLIDHNSFKGCSKLSVINLDRNQLTVDMFFDPAKNPLFGLAALTHLSLASNHLGDLIQEPFSAEIHILQCLNLSNNGISLIEHNSLTDLIHLKTLDLSANQIARLDSETFRGLKALIYLDLSRNKLSSLSADLFIDCTKLQQLYLSGNCLTEVDVRAFSGLSSLRVLSLNSNCLKSIPTPLPTTLQQLYLNSNPQLVSIESSNALISPELTLLSISNCTSLTEIGPHSFAHLPRLQKVLVNGNGCLVTISRDAFRGKNSSVTWLNFSHNALVTLNEVLVNWWMVSGGDLSGNAWNCDCEMEWIRHKRLSESLLQTIVLVLSLSYAYTTPLASVPNSFPLGKKPNHFVIS